MTGYSLRRRLLLWLTLATTALGVIALADTWREAVRTAQGLSDRVLEGSALAIAERVTVDEGGQRREVTGDWYIGALPVERMAPLVSSAMAALDGRLGKLAALSNNVQWMNGIQYYLSRDVPITHGHIIFMDSPWALTAVSQRQFWTGNDIEDWGDGRTQGVLSVDISQWDAPGMNGKAASESKPQARNRWSSSETDASVQTSDWKVASSTNSRS